MSRKYKFHNPEGLYFVTFATEGWTDVFTRNEYKNILVDNLAYCQKNKGLEIFAWCIMTNHVHLMVRATEGHLLQDILRDFKKFTSKAILKAIAENQRESRKEWLLKQFSTSEGNRFWRSDNKPIELWSNATIDQKLNYIHQNPVEEGLVFRAEDYVYSSANDYAGGARLIGYMGDIVGVVVARIANPRQLGAEVAGYIVNVYTMVSSVGTVALVKNASTLKRIFNWVNLFKNSVYILLEDDELKEFIVNNYKYGFDVVTLLESIKNAETTISTANSLIFSKDLIDKAEAIYSAWALISSDKQVQLKLDRDSINNITQLLLEYKSFINDEIIY